MMPSRSLHARFHLAAAAMAAIVAMILAAVVYLTARNHYVANGTASARSVVTAVQKSLAVGVYAQDQVLLDELAQGIVRHPAIAKVIVRNASGLLIATAMSPEAAAEDLPVGVAPPPTFETALMSPFNPSESAGSLEVFLDSTSLVSDARRQAAILVAVVIVALATMFAVFNALARRLMAQPMHELADQLVRIEPGARERLSIPVRHEADEVGVVAAAANRLLELQQGALERERAMRDEISLLEARYRGIFDSTSAGIFILAPGGELLQGNPALGRALGLPAESLLSAGFPNFAKAVFDRPSKLLRLIEQSRQTGQPQAMDLEVVRHDGERRWVHCMISSIVDPATQEPRAEGVLYDITERKRVEHAAHHQVEHDTLTGLKSRAFIESALERSVRRRGQEGEAVTLMFIDLDGFKAVNDRWGHAAGDAVLVEAARRLRVLFQRTCDVVGRLGGDELVVMVDGMHATHPSISEMASRLIGTFREHFVLPNGEQAQVGASVGVASYPLHATSAETLIHAADAAMYAVKQSGKGGFVIAQAEASDAAGGPGAAGGAGTSAADSVTVVPAEVEGPLRPIPGKSRGALAPATLGHRDPLTGLADRRQLAERLALAHVRVREGAPHMAVICMDIDQFSLLNVAYGTHTGDEVLCQVATRLAGVLRREDALARTGSDEFVAVVQTTAATREDARTMAETVALKLLASLAEPFAVSTGVLNVQARAGVSLIEPDTPDGSDALHEAQLALRSCKSAGRSALVIFEHQMMAGLQEQMALEEDLRRAIASHQFVLHVQPQVDGDGRLMGGEALLRWHHPQRGMVRPDQFIPLAESSGAIVELGAWVLEEGCRVLARMHAMDSQLTLAVNISPVQFNHPDFIRHVRDALDESGAPPRGLILEITEGLLVRDVAHVSERLAELVAMGVRFSIDDFGTGFSSLAYLRQLPLHEIKIDRGFVTGLPHDVANSGIVRSILSMGSHLGLHVVAEGVETQEQSDFLVAHGCPSLQGWLHGKPMPVDDFLSRARSLRAKARAMRASPSDQGEDSRHGELVDVA